MKTLDEVLDETAQNFGYEDYYSAVAWNNTNEILLITKSASTVYARQVAESVKAEAAKIAFEGVDVEYNITFMDIEKFIK